MRRPGRQRRSVTALKAAAGLLVVTLIAGLSSGCKEEKVPPPPNTPTTPTASTTDTPAPADPVTEATQAEPEALPASVIIDEKPVEFPPAVLVLRETDDGCEARLYTDDPKEMLDGGYRGNSFYFEMPMDGMTVNDVLTGGSPQTPDGQRLTTAFAYDATDSRRTGTPNGLFLDGGRFTLQPKGAEFILDPNGPALSVEIHGMFRRFEGDEAFSGERVVVRATLVPEIVEE